MATTSKAAPEPGGTRYANCKHCDEMIVKYPRGTWVHVDTQSEEC